MVIDVKEVLDFLYCPLIVKYKRDNKITKLKNIKEKYEEDMHKFTYAYHLIKEQNGITIDKAKKIFAGLWLKNKLDDYIYVDSGDKRNTFEGLRKKGIDTIFSFHYRMGKEEYKTILAGYYYTVPIEKGLSLSGVIDLVADTKHGLSLVDFKPLSTLYRKESIKKDIELVSMYYAFTYMFNIEPDLTYVQMLDKDQRIPVTEIDVEMFKTTVKSIAMSITNNLYYRANFDRCYKCVYVNECTRLSIESRDKNED